MRRGSPPTRSSITWKPETSIVSVSVQEERSDANSARRAVSLSSASFWAFFEQLLLLRQQRDQSVALLSQLAALLLLGAQGSVGLAQLLL